MYLRTLRSSVNLASLCLACCLLGFPIAEAESILYRYNDANGRLVLSYTIPPEFVSKGYQVVDSTGRVLHDIPAAATAEQIAERKLKQAELARKEELTRLQKQKDAYLQHLYRHPDDAIRAKERKLLEIDVLNNQKKLELKNQKKKIRELESKAANIEQSGKKVPDDLLNEINIQHKEADRFRSELSSHDKARTETIKEFDADIQRLQELRVRAETGTALNIESLQGSWLIVMFNDSPTKDNDQWDFEGDRFFQNFNGLRRTSPVQYTVNGNNIDLGYTKIKVIKFPGHLMAAEMTGSTYNL